MLPLVMVQTSGRVNLIKKSWIISLARICVGLSPAASCEKFGSVDGQSCSARTKVSKRSNVAASLKGQD